MTKPFDFKDVDAALKRAAKIGANGTREERSGRFVLEQDPKTRSEYAFKSGDDAKFTSEKPARKK